MSSTAIKLTGGLHYSRFCSFMGQFLKAHEKDLYRSKGICAIGDRTAKYVFQGVHSLCHFQASETHWQENETRASTVVFIGRNLDEKRLRAELEKCVLQPSEVEDED